MMVFYHRGFQSKPLRISAIREEENELEIEAGVWRKSYRIIRVRARKVLNIKGGTRS